jgi:hypothetical protein
MAVNDIPFNIDLLQINDEDIKRIRAVTSLDTFEGVTKNFHPDGLFSTTTFGVAGSDARYLRYGYIDLKLPVIHPTIYKSLMGLRSLYSDILASREFVRWDANLADFVKSDVVDGYTGYAYFIEHWHKIEFEQRPSVKREQAVAFIDKYRDKSMVQRVLVIPASLRDLEIDDNGRESSDEINALYYKLIAISNTINLATIKVSPEAYNSQRVSLQNTFNEVYEYLAAIVEGKKNLMMGKWASRKIFNGTRNVITAMGTVTPHLDAPGHLGFNDTAVGLYQTLKAILPVSQYQLRSGFLSEVFTSPGAPALLVNKKTLQSERVQLRADEYDAWMTNEGLEKFITYFQEDTIRHSFVSVADHYVGLLYRGPDATFKLLHGIDELPPGRNKEDCRPLTRAELLYTAIYKVANKYPCFLTRYPVGGIGSIYPSNTFLKTTVKTVVLQELGEDWKPLGEGHIAYEFPTDTNFFNSISPHSSRLAMLGADRI